MIELNCTIMLIRRPTGSTGPTFIKIRQNYIIRSFAKLYWSLANVVHVLFGKFISPIFCECIYNFYSVSLLRFIRQYCLVDPSISRKWCEFKRFWAYVLYVSSETWNHIVRNQWYPQRRRYAIYRWYTVPSPLTKCSYFFEEIIVNGTLFKEFSAVLISDGVLPVTFFSLDPLEFIAISIFDYVSGTSTKIYSSLHATSNNMLELFSAIWL